MKTIESHLQQTCITWFRYQHPLFSKRLFAIPNGGQRSLKAGSKAKAEGMMAGVWDLFLAVPNHFNYQGGLFIEMKAPKGKLTESQTAFQTELNGVQWEMLGYFDWKGIVSPVVGNTIVFVLWMLIYR
jgi:hypothetical protein